MKINEVLQESAMDKLRALAGKLRSKIVGSMQQLLSLFKKNPNAELTTVADFEVLNKTIISRVDTGANSCSIDARDIKIEGEKVTFTFEGTTFTKSLTRIKDVRSASGTTSRPRVLLDYSWGGKTFSGVETNLVDRSKLKFRVLVGRNLIAKMKVAVRVPETEVTD